jgi:hypothetical protein
MEGYRLRCAGSLAFHESGAELAPSKLGRPVDSGAP